MIYKTTTFGKRKPKNTKRNILIKKAVKRAVKDYKDTFHRLANA